MTAAARLLDTNVATVSRRIERMGETLGFPPLVKTNDGWVMNPKLRGLMDTLETFDAELTRELNSTLDHRQDQPTRIRIGLPPVVALQVLYPCMDAVLPSLKAIRLEFIGRSQGEGLSDFDIVIQTHRPESGRLLSRRIGQLHFRVFGPPDCDARTDWCGLVREHDDHPAQQMALAAFGQEPLIRSHSFTDLFEIIRASRLPGLLPGVLATRDSDLTPVLPTDQVATQDLWLMYHASRKGDPVIRIVTEWIETSFVRMAGPEGQTDLECFSV